MLNSNRPKIEIESGRVLELDGSLVARRLFFDGAEWSHETNNFELAGQLASIPDVTNAIDTFEPRSFRCFIVGFDLRVNLSHHNPAREFSWVLHVREDIKTKDTCLGLFMIFYLFLSD
jgi:hypothetical protein